MSLFKTIEEVRQYISVDENYNFDDFKPSIDDAEQSFIKKLLGDFYPVLLADYTDNTNADGSDNGMDADYLLLLPYVQRSLAHYAVYKALPIAGLSIGSSGLQEMFSNNSRPAPRYKIRDAQLATIQKADEHADLLLEYLEENATVLKYTEWFNDPEANTAMSGIIVYKTSIASKYIDINESRRIFLRLKKRIRDIEQNDVKRMLCSDQYDAIVTQLKEDSLTDANRALLDLLEPYISKKALYLALPSLRVSITDEGILMHSSNDSVVQKSQATDKSLAELKCSIKGGKEDYDQGFEDDWNKLDQFLIDNIADYPLIQGSPCYTSKVLTPPKYAPDNDPENKHFSV